jgi:putative PEP-CTERM system TPR-repeat lipoprotein
MSLLRRLVCCLGQTAVTVVLTGCSQSADSHAQRGDNYVKDGNVDAAVLEYRNAIAKNPQMSSARLKLGALYLRKGNGAGALEEYVRAADLLPNDPEAQLTAGRLLLAAGRSQDAIARADRALGVKPQDAEALVLRANALAGLRDIDGAIEQIEQAISIDSSANRQVNLGVFQQVKGRPAEAEAAFRRAVAADPKSSDAQLALGQFLSGMGRQEEADTAFKAALALNPADPVANRSLAAFYIASGRAAEAEPLLRRLAAGKGNSSKFALADYYVRTKRAPEAIAVLERLAKTPTAWAMAQSKLAAVHFNNGKEAEGLALIDEVLRQQPNYPLARIVRGEMLLAQGKATEALAEAQRAVALEPRSVAAHYLLGSVNQAQRDVNAAARAYGEVLRLNPRAHVAQLRLAEVELQRQSPGAAAQLAGQVAERVPGNVAAELILVRSLSAQRDLARASAAMSKLLAEYPNVGAVHAQAGLLAMRKNDPVAARASFERALTIDSELFEPFAGLVTLDLMDREFVRARARVEERLAKTPTDSAVLHLAARTWASTGDEAKAIELLNRAVDANAASFESYAYLARLYSKQGKLDQARAEYERLSSVRTESSAPATMAAIILELQGRRDEAKRRYEAIVERDPQAAVASNNLAFYYASRGEQLDRALQLAQAAKARMPDDAAVNDTLGLVYLKKQLAALAVPPLRLAVEKAPAEAVIRYHLGLALYESGDKVGAKRELQEALRLKSDFDEADTARKILQSLS